MNKLFFIMLSAALILSCSTTRQSTKTTKANVYAWVVKQGIISIYLEDDILRFDLTQCPSRTCLLNQQDAKDIVKILKNLGYTQFSNSKNSISEGVYVQQKPDGLYQWHFSHQNILEIKSKAHKADFIRISASGDPTFRFSVNHTSEVAQILMQILQESY